MKPGELYEISQGLLGLNLTLIDLRRSTYYTHTLGPGDMVIVLEERLIEKERKVWHVFSKHGKLWCYFDEVERHLVCP